MRAQNRSTPVSEIVTGKSFHRPLGGFIGVANVGLDANWLHHPLAMANLYGFGKLAWNPDLTAAEIIAPWTRLTFGNDPKVVDIVDGLQINSWRVYEQYTGPLGIGGAHQYHWHPLWSRALSPPSATAGDSGSAPIAKVSVWTAP